MPSLKGVISNRFWETAATNIPEEILSVRFASAARLCHGHKVSAATNKFLRAKTEWAYEVRNLLYNVL
jgi:hypothetical protein